MSTRKFHIRFAVFVGLLLSFSETSDALTTFGTVKEITSGFDSSQAVAAGDIDGDGDNDVVVTSIIDNTITWYENIDGTGVFNGPNLVSDTAAGPASVALGDFDDDGDIDIVAALQNDNSVALYTNLDGAGTFDSALILSSNTTAVASVIAADIDGDDDTDIVAASTGNDEIVWFRNQNNSPNLSSAQTIATDANGVVNIFAADLDQDDDLDLVAALFGDNTIAWYENTNGNGSFGSKQIVTTNVQGATSVFAADVNGANGNDVFYTSAFTDQVIWIENTDGAGTFGGKRFISGNIDGAFSLFAADLDADNDIDLVSTSLISGQLSWHENLNGNGSFSEPKIINDENTPASQVIVANVDSDTSNDIVFASGQTTSASWINNQNVAPPPAIEVDTSPDLALTLDFGTYVVGSPRITKTVTIKNIGERDLNTSVSILNNGSGTFQLESSPVSILRALESDSFEVSFSPTKHGPISGGVQIDTNTSSGIVSIELKGAGLDQDYPVPTFDPLPAIITSATITDYKLTFSEPVERLFGDKFQTSGIQVTDFSGFGTNYTMTLNFTSNDGPKSISLPQNSTKDVYGYWNLPSNTVSTILDQFQPTPLISSVPAHTQLTSWTDIPLTFSEPVEKPAIADFITDGVTITAIRGSGSSYVIDFTINEPDGLKQFYLKADAVQDTAGSKNLVSNTVSINLDRVAPISTLAALPEFTNQVLINDYQVSFDEPVFGLTLSDFERNGVTITNLRGSGADYTIDLEFSDEDGIKEIILPEFKVFDAASNSNAVPASQSTTLDRESPEVVLASLPSITNESILTDYSIMISESTSPLVIDDFVTTGIIVTNLRQANNDYLVDLEFTPEDGTKEIMVPAASVSDPAGNENLATAVESILVDRIAPIATLQKLPNYTITNSLTNYHVTFSEPIEGLELNDFITDGITITNLTGSDQSYTVDLEFTGEDGMKSLMLTSGAVSDPAGNSNEASELEMIILNTSIPVPVLTSLPSITNDSVFTSFTVQFQESVSELEIADFLTTGIVVTNLRQSDNDYLVDLEFTPEDGTKEIMIPAGSVSDVAGNENTASAVESILVDRIAPIATLETLPDYSITNSLTNYQVTFSEPIEGLELSDFITDGITISNLMGSDQGYTIDLEFTGVDGMKSLMLSAGAVNDPAGNSNEASELQTIILNTSVPVPVLSSLPSMTADTVFTSFTVQFQETVTGLEIDDFLTTGIIVTNLAGNQNEYTIDLELDGADGEKSIMLPQNSVANLAGTDNIDSDLRIVLLDTTAPESMAVLAESEQNVGDINGTYSVIEEGSGIDQVELYVKEPSSASFTLIGTISGGTFTFTPTKQGEEAVGIYSFYTQATDLVSNTEEPPAAEDARIQLVIPATGNFWMIQ